MAAGVQHQGMSPDRRAELTLGALVCAVLLFVLLIVVFVLREAWPSFAHNGLHWFGVGGNPDQQIQAIYTATDLGKRPTYTFHAWPIVWGTLCATVGAV